MLEHAHEIGGKFLFATCQAIAVVSMFASRRAAATQEAKGLPSVPSGAGVVSGQVAHGGFPVAGVLVGQPVLGPSSQELQQQVAQLNYQVQELTRLVTGQHGPKVDGKAVMGTPVEMQQLCGASSPAAAAPQWGPQSLAAAPQQPRDLI